MKRIITALILAVCLSALAFSCSKDSNDSDTIKESDKFIGTYECVTGDFLIITKTDSKTLNLEFLDEIGETHDWDHTFVATVSGNILTVTKQYWSQVSSLVSATGNLSGSVLTIDYYYHSDGHTEDGLIYHKMP